MSNVQVQVLLERVRLPEGREQRLQGVVRLTAGQQVSSRRAPVELVACLDVSGSMEGRKLHSARDTARRLVKELGERDRLGLVAFASHAEVEAPLARMDALGRERATRSIESLHTRGSTHMSAGLVTSLDLLREGGSAGRDDRALRRVLLFTDGHANRGLPEGDRERWADLLAQQLGNMSVSWFGYGEDHDAAFLAWLADQTRGNAYVAKDADAIADAFAKELGGLLGTVAHQVRVRIVGAHGTPVLLNDEPSSTSGRTLQVELTDLTSEERRDLVFTLPVEAGASGGKRRVAEVEVSWVETSTGRTDSVVVAAEVAFVHPSDADAPDLAVKEAVVLQEAARAMRAAAALADEGAFVRAEVLLREAALLARDVSTERAREVAGLLERLAADYGHEEVYTSSRSRLRSISRSMSKQRGSGSEVDFLFTTEAQDEMVEKFGLPPGTVSRPPRKRGS